MLKLLQSTLLITVIYYNAFAQQGKGTVKGRILSSDSLPAAYVPVGIKGTATGTTTDSKGQYQFKAPSGKHILLISFTGHEPEEKEITVTEGLTTEIEDFTLRETAKELNEVVVTSGKGFKEDETSPSLRQTTPILELPQNIQIINKELIASQQSFDMLEGISRNVSGVQRLEHWDNYARINMRGSQIAAFRNGMNVQMPWGPLAEDMSMVERIEFVKGPAGFMMAAGEPAGFYNIYTKKPSGVQKGEATFTLGSFNTYRSTIDLDGKLSKNGKLLYRLNVMGMLKGSHRDYEFNNRYSIVPVIKYLIDDKSALTLEYSHQFSEMSAIGSNYAFSKRGYADLPVNFTTAEPNLAPTRSTDRSLLAIFEHKLSADWKLTAQAAYFQYDQKGQSLWPTRFARGNDSLLLRGTSLWDALGQNKNAQMFLNGKVITGPVSHNMLGGVDLSFKDYYADWNQGGPLGDTTFNIYKPKYGQVAADAIPDWDRTDDIRVRGVRYVTGANSIYVQDEIGLADNRIKLTLAGRYSILKTVNPYNGTSSDEKFTPRAGINFLIGRGTAVYALYDQAFIANYGTDWQGRSFIPVTAHNTEAGIKKDWFGGKWNSAISVYRITKNNVLTADPDHFNAATGQFYSRQSGQQVAEGVETDIKGQIVRGLDVVINYAYTEAKTTKDTKPEMVGKQVSGATRHIHNTWITYSLPQSFVQGVKLSAGYQYQSGRSTWAAYDSGKNPLPDYFRLDAGISYQKDRFGLGLIVYNVLDEYLYSGAPYGTYFYWQTEPKLNGRITASYRF